MQEQVERIRVMENHMREAEKAQESLERALSQYIRAKETLKAAVAQYEETLEGIEALKAYLQSPEWLADYDAERAGKLPKDMPCGVLSEDGIDTLLWRDQRLRERLNESV